MKTKKTRLDIIENKVINQESLKKLADVVWQKYQASTNPEREIEFRLFCDKQATYYGNDICIIDEVVDEKVIGFEVNLKNASPFQHLTLKLSHGNPDDESFSDNYIEILNDTEETTSDQAEGFVTKLKRTLETIPNQVGIERYRILISLMTTLIVFYGAASLFDYMSSTDEGFRPFWDTRGKNFGDILILGTFFGLTFGLGIGQQIMTYAKKLWPEIEFQIAPKHMLLEKRRRAFLWTVANLLIIPFILSVITSVILG